MPYASNGAVTVRYEVDGDGANDEAVVYCGDVGLGPWGFAWQHAAVAGPRRTIVPETRGIGESDAPPGPYAVADLVDDLDEVLRAEGIRNAHVFGYGLGGMVALEYAHRSSRPASLVVFGTPPAGDRYDPDGVWADPADPDAVRASFDALLSAEFRERHASEVDRMVDWRLAEDATPETFDAHRAAVEGFDLSDRLYEVTTPTLVVHGSEDAICPVAAGASLAEGLPRGELLRIEGAGHLVGVEASAAVNDALIGWLAEHAADPFE